jgi:hypothetical protein
VEDGHHSEVVGSPLAIGGKLNLTNMKKAGDHAIGSGIVDRLRIDTSWSANKGCDDWTRLPLSLLKIVKEGTRKVRSRQIKALRWEILLFFLHGTCPSK